MGYYSEVRNRLTEIYSRISENKEVPDDEIRFAVDMINIDRLYNIETSPNLYLYRARYNEGFDDRDITQFSYIHDSNHIRRLRYNKDREAVLYTSTCPNTAFEEIRKNTDISSFYLSVWQLENGEHVVHSNVFNPDNCTRGSNAGKYADVLNLKIIGAEEAKPYLESIGKMMELSGEDYRFSSELASKILSRCDSIISVSAKSNGKELNITFNQQSADKKVKLRYVLLCDIPSVQNSLFNVSKIGINNGEYIDWFKYELDQTYLVSDFDSFGHAMLCTKLLDTPYEISPIAIEGNNNSYLFFKITDGKHTFKYRYLLKKIENV